ncbi:MAG: heavy-metal-associated domain-containing protein [Proteobacteria bacterium]|nr:heavy-metal-associated domain-containing protein [Pseudomonadota bacterium]
MLASKVSGMTCGHCVTAVTKAVNTVPLVESVKVDLLAWRSHGRRSSRCRCGPASHC